MESSVGEHHPAGIHVLSLLSHGPLGIVQRASLPFLLALYPAKPPQPAGKGRGSAHPKPKEHFLVVYKTKSGYLASISAQDFGF